MLAGNTSDYASFWSLLIGKAAKTNSPVERWTAITPFPTVNTPVNMQIETAMPPGQIIMNGESASPAQDEQLPFQWRSTWWPKQYGWNSIQRTNGQPEWVFIYNMNNWAGIKAVNKVLGTKKYASGTAPGSVTKQIHQKVKILLPKFYFLYAVAVVFHFFMGRKQNVGKITARLSMVKI